MSEPIKIGIVGVGQRGLNHMVALWDLQRAGKKLVKINALCDAFEENLSEEKIQRYVEGFQIDGISTYTDFDKMLSDSQLDAIYFSIPPGCHNGELIKAANSRIHIFAEKPMSLYMDEAIEMERVIKENGIISSVGFQMRYDTWYEAAKGFLADKRMVMINMISNGSLESHSIKHTATEKRGGPSNRIWAANIQWSGSTVVEAGIHQLDLMRYWCGDIEWVQAAYVHRDKDDIVDGGDNPYGYVVTFGFKNGSLGNLIITRLRKVYYGDGYQNITWAHGHLKFEQTGPVAYYYDGPYPPSATPGIEMLRHPVAAPPRIDVTYEINKAFIDAVLTNNQAKVRSTFSDSMNSLAAVLAANVSDKLKGERIYLEEFIKHPRYEEFRSKIV